MRRTNIQMTLSGFIKRVLQKDKNQSDSPFCFILGAGASKQSGIETGAELAQEWLKELHEESDFEGKNLKEWATAETLGIPNFVFKEAARFYPEIYQRRFPNKHDGFAFLERKMEGKEPSFGYAVLSYLLSVTQHKIVISTNFDNLVADALSVHSKTFPIVVSDDALTGYAQVQLRRPLIAKVHGGVGFNLKNNLKEVSNLPENWKQALRRIFKQYTPIVIGYDGNDGSLMNTIEECLRDRSLGGIYWCYHCPNEKHDPKLNCVPDRVQKLINSNESSYLIPIPGFDELMMLLHKEFADKGRIPSIPDIQKKMEDRARDREKNFDEQVKLLIEKTSDRSTKTKRNEESESGKMLQSAAASIKMSFKEKPWWVWENEASSASNVEEREYVYEEALMALPKNSNLLGNYATFLKRERKDYNKAEEYYRRAIEADPKHTGHLGNYANFLCQERKDYDQAEEYYKRAIEADPKHAIHLGNYATFLCDERKDYDKAEEYYKRAIEADPNHSGHLGNYASFLFNERKDYDKAEEYYKRALEADPLDATHLGNYANFLFDERKDYDKAEEYYNRALEEDPNHANNLGNYANFLWEQRKEYDKAQEYFNRALEIAPRDANILGNYAEFWWKARKNLDKAEEYYLRAFQENPKDVYHLRQYAAFLREERNDPVKAEEYLRRAAEAEAERGG